MTAPTSAPSHRPPSQAGLLALAMALTVAGVVGLALAAEYAPTLANMLTHEWVLKPAAHRLLRLLSFAALLGALLAASIAVRRYHAFEGAR